MQKDTLIVHSGERLDAAPNPLTPPIFQSSVYVFDDLHEASDVVGGLRAGYAYARSAQPNADLFGAAVAALEEAKRGVVAASGTGAILAALVAARRGDGPVAIAKELYGGSYALCRDFLQPLGIDFVRFDAHDPKTLPENVSVVLAESVSNPHGGLTDVRQVADAAHARGARLVIDNTFATPLLVRPLACGADLVVHSATKFLSGHGDVILGVLAGADALCSQAESSLVTFGATPDAFACWLALRGLRTLGLRMERAFANAAGLAAHLAGEPSVRRVHHPTLAEHPDHWLAERDLGGRGSAILSFDLDDEQAAADFVSRTKLVRYAPSLGDFSTTLSHPATASHRALSDEQQRELGIMPGTLRVSVGIEALEDLIADFKEALRG